MIIEQQISIDASKLDYQLPQHLFDRVKSLYENQCFKKFGYITKVNSLLAVRDNVISSASSRALFDVKFDVSTLRPELGATFKGEVCLCSDIGVLVQIKSDLTDVFKILITSHTLRGSRGYVFDDIARIFISKDGKTTIEPGSSIEVVITQIKYENREFKCIGRVPGVEPLQQNPIVFKEKVKKSKATHAPKPVVNTLKSKLK